MKIIARIGILLLSPLWILACAGAGVITGVLTTGDAIKQPHMSVKEFEENVANTFKQIMSEKK